MYDNKNPDGTYNHFEMRGGTFEGWLSSLNEVVCRAERSAASGVEMDMSSINGTCVLTSVLDDLANRLAKLQEAMIKYREDNIPIKACPSRPSESELDYDYQRITVVYHPHIFCHKSV